MTKRMSYTVSFKLKAVELAEATSNWKAGKELGINEKLVRYWRKKKMELVELPKASRVIWEKYVGQNLRYLDTPIRDLYSVKN